jgi:hypothetical protein
MLNLESTIIAQYANSPILLTLINNMNAYIDPSTNMNNFYSQIWNINTAQGYGLDVWGRILGINRYITIPPTTTYFGFAEAILSGTYSWEGWSQAPFWNGADALSGSSTETLTDNAFRTLLLAKALLNITSCSSQSINVLLTTLFAGYGNAYVKDTGNMTMTVYLFFQPTILQLAILQTSGIIPIPTGVSLSLSPGYVPATTIGFNGSGLSTWNQGTFWNDNLV